MNWWEQAACANQAGLYYHTEDPEAVERMIDICSACPVQLPCLREGQAHNDRHTVRAGLRLWRKEERPW